MREETPQSRPVLQQFARLSRRLAQQKWNKLARPVLPAIALLCALVLGGTAWNGIAP